MLNPLAWRLLRCPVVPCLPRQHFVIAAAVRSMMARAKEASLSCWAMRLSWSPFHLISGKHLLSRRRYNAYRPRVWARPPSRSRAREITCWGSPHGINPVWKDQP